MLRGFCAWAGGNAVCDTVPDALEKFLREDLLARAEYNRLHTFRQDFLWREEVRACVSVCVSVCERVCVSVCVNAAVVCRWTWRSRRTGPTWTKCLASSRADSSGVRDCSPSMYQAPVCV